MAGPLTGTRVLEMANFISGPYAAMLLADLGAQVIKIEMPGTGDPFRGWGERPGFDKPQFAAYNRGKQAVTINLQTEGGREVYGRLARTVDVVIENFRPGTADRMGVGYEALRAENPRLVYCAITGLGSTGPDSKRPIYDAIAQAMSGLWSVFTDMQHPVPVGPPMADQLTGVYAAYGILAALTAREQSGCGQRLDVSMLGAGMAFMTEPIANYLFDGEVSHNTSRPRRSQSYAFVAGDGLPLAIHLSTPPKFWQGLATAVGRADLIEDPRFKHKSGRIERYDELHDLLQERFKTRPRAEWLEILEQHDVPSAPIQNVAEAVEHRQARHIGMVRRFGSGERARDLVGFPVEFSETTCEPGLAPPQVGEHNATIFNELGYAEDELERLRGEGAV